MGVGETRFTSGTMYTDQLYTGQREMTGLGIYHYQARFYSPRLGRFLSADTIIPVFENPQSWNRYAYVNNAPTRFTDPSGHEICMDGGYCGKFRGSSVNPIQYWKDLVKSKFGVTLSDSIDAWSVRNASTVYFALLNQDTKLGGRTTSFSWGTVYRFEQLHVCTNGSANCYNATTYRSGSITFRSTGYLANQNIYHEFGHVMNFRSGNYFSDALADHEIYTPDGDFVMGGPGDEYNYQRNSLGYANPRVQDPNWGSAPAQQHAACADMTDNWCVSGHTPSEEWGDLWANYVSSNYSVNIFGSTRQNWVVDQVNQYYLSTIP